MTITNVSEAQEAAAAISSFLAEFQKMIGPVKSAPSKPPQQRESVQVESPVSMPDRVFKILRDAGGPIGPKEMVERHHAHGWSSSGGDDKKLYSKILSCAFYLVKKGKIKKDDKGYSLIQ